MTRLVTTLQAGTAAGMARLAQRCTTPWVEVRLDALREGRDALVGLRRGVRQRCIATCRAPAQGGSFRGSEAEREAWLRGALQAGFDAVDVEEDAPFRRRIVEEAQRLGAEVIVSRHDLDAPDPRAALLGRSVPAGGIAKYAARVRGPEDLALLLTVAAELRGQGVPFAVMGLGDASLRLLAPLLGSELVYCAPPEGEPAAPGQLPAERVRAVHALLRSPPRAAPRLVLLLGDPVAHSASPAMQNAAFAAQGDALLYAAVRVPARKLGAAVRSLRDLGAAGANVTVPHKQGVLRHLDALHPAARAVGAVNTIVDERGRLVGHNTDGAGALDALREAGCEPRGARCLVLGAGGTGRAVAHALAAASAQVRVANRSPAPAASLARALGGEAVPWSPAALREAVRASDVVVHATTLGMEGRATPLPAATLRPKLVVLDAVYRPGGSPLVRAARRRGCVAVPGERMLLHQGARAYALWTGRPAPVGIMRQALHAALEEP
jgi:shikimate dehydrogenase